MGLEANGDIAFKLDAVDLHIRPTPVRQDPLSLPHNAATAHSLPPLQLLLLLRTRFMIDCYLFPRRCSYFISTCRAHEASALADIHPSHLKHLSLTLEP